MNAGSDREEFREGREPMQAVKLAVETLKRLAAEAEPAAPEGKSEGAATDASAANNSSLYVFPEVSSAERAPAERKNGEGVFEPSRFRDPYDFSDQDEFSENGEVPAPPRWKRVRTLALELVLASGLFLTLAYLTSPAPYGEGGPSHAIAAAMTSVRTIFAFRTDSDATQTRVQPDHAASSTPFARVRDVIATATVLPAAFRPETPEAAPLPALAANPQPPTVLAQASSAEPPIPLDEPALPVSGPEADQSLRNVIDQSAVIVPAVALPDGGPEPLPASVQPVEPSRPTAEMLAPSAPVDIAPSQLPAVTVTVEPLRIPEAPAPATLTVASPAPTALDKPATAEPREKAASLSPATEIVPPPLPTAMGTPEPSAIATPAIAAATANDPGAPAALPFEGVAAAPFSIQRPTVSNAAAERLAELAEALAAERKAALERERERAEVLTRELARTRAELGSLKASNLLPKGPSVADLTALPLPRNLDPIAPPAAQDMSVSTPVTPPQTAPIAAPAVAVPAVPPAAPRAGGTAEQPRKEAAVNATAPVAEPLSSGSVHVTAQAQPPARGWVGQEGGRIPSLLGAAPPAVAPPSAAPQPAAPPPEAATRETPATLSEKRLLDRAEALLNDRDIAGARLILEHAAEGGSSRAVFLLAQTYDPKLLAQWRILGIPADEAKARDLYAKALLLGVTEAGRRANELRAVSR
jgi:hypothetical protein